MFHMQMFTYMCLYRGLYTNIYLLNGHILFYLMLWTMKIKVMHILTIKITENVGEHKVKINDNLI